jgi:hypothetical protein
MFFSAPAIISILMTSIEVLIEKTSLQSLTREKEELPTSISVACRAADVNLDAVGFTSIDLSRFNKSTNWAKIHPIQDDEYIFVNNTEYCDMV